MNKVGKSIFRLVLVAQLSNSAGGKIFPKHLSLDISENVTICIAELVDQSR